MVRFFMGIEEWNKIESQNMDSSNGNMIKVGIAGYGKIGQLRHKILLNRDDGKWYL